MASSVWWYHSSFIAVAPLVRCSSVLAAISAALLLAGCDDGCVKSPITREQAVEIAQDYLLTRSIADFEAGPSGHQRFARELREDGIDDASLKRIASAQVYGPRRCGFHSNIYEVDEDPIALQGFNVLFKEYVPDAQSPDAVTIRMLSIAVSYCGNVFRGDLGPRFSLSEGRIPRSYLAPHCNRNTVQPSPYTEDISK